MKNLVKLRHETSSLMLHMLPLELLIGRIYVSLFWMFRVRH